MVKIALINPSQNLTKIYGELSQEAPVLPPLGLCYLASALREAKLAKVKIIDAQALKISNKKAATKALLWGADIIGITATTDMIFLASEIADFVKAKSKKTKIIVGGPHISAVPEKTLKMFPSFDIGVINEGEETTKELVSTLEAGKSLKKVKGIVYREGNKIITTVPREFIQNLDSLLPPAWDLLPHLTKFYKPAIMNYKNSPSTSIITSRGCPGQCAFCDTRVFGCRYRVHSAKYALDMIRFLKKKYGIKDIIFYDDQFTIFKERLAQICEGLQSLGITWSCQARVNAVDFKTMKMMKDAGCWKISFGIESASPKILKLMNKRINLRQAKKAISDAKRAGLEVLGYFIIGFFGETKKTLAMTKKFILNSDLDMIMLSYFLPFPGSPAYPLVNQFGEFHEDWKNLNAFDPDIPQFIPYGLSTKELIAAQKDIYRSFYLRPKIMLRYCQRMLKNPTEAARFIRTAFNFSKFLFSSNHV